MKDRFKKIGSAILGTVAAVGTAMGNAIAAHAEGTSSVAQQMGSAVSAGASEASSSIVSMLTNVAPIIIGIVVGVIVLTAGIKWIKKIRSNAA